MIITPHQVAMFEDRHAAPVRTGATDGVRWTWIAGRRYRINRRL